MDDGILREDGAALTKNGIPKLLESGHSTMSSTLKPIEFKGTLGHWTQFEQEVRRNFRSQSWTENVLSFRSKNPGRNNVYNEQLYVGDEHSMCARFNQQVGHVMTSVVQDLGIPIRFGDIKAAVTEGEDVPDFAAIDGNGVARLVGEGKVPWQHDILDAYNGGLGISQSFRHMLGESNIAITIENCASDYMVVFKGQIVGYMKSFKRKYGFLTTYEETLFLKQSQDSAGNWVLWYSNIIHHSTTSAHQQGDESYVGRVSLRECMLYFLCEINRDYVAVNNEPHWTGRRGKAYGSKSEGRHIDDREGDREGDGARRPGLREKASKLLGLGGASSGAGKKTRRAGPEARTIILLRDRETKDYYFFDAWGGYHWAPTVKRDTNTNKLFITLDEKSVWVDLRD